MTDRIFKEPTLLDEPTAFDKSIIIRIQDEIQTRNARAQTDFLSSAHGLVYAFALSDNEWREANKAMEDRLERMRSLRAPASPDGRIREIVPYSLDGEHIMRAKIYSASEQYIEPPQQEAPSWVIPVVVFSAFVAAGIVLAWVAA